MSVINKRCTILQSLGFSIQHEDSCVEMNGILFDFSATDETKFVEQAVKTAYQVGLNHGVEKTQASLRSIIGLDF